MRGPPTHPQAQAWEAMFGLGLVGAALDFGRQMAGQAAAAWETGLCLLNATPQIERIKKLLGASNLREQADWPPV